MVWEVQANHCCLTIYLSQEPKSQPLSCKWSKAYVQHTTARKKKKRASEVHNCLWKLVNGMWDHDFANSYNLYENYAQESRFCQTLHEHYLSVLNWHCLQYKDRLYWFVFSREFGAARRGGGRWMLLVYPQKARPRHCECRLSSPVLGKRYQGLSGSFNPCPLSRYCPLAGQLTVASGWGLLSENCVRSH